MTPDRWMVALSLAAIAGLSLGIALEAVIGVAGVGVGMAAAVAVAAGPLSDARSPGGRARRI